jgi:hypothetical protein
MADSIDNKQMAEISRFTAEKITRWFGMAVCVGFLLKIGDGQPAYCIVPAYLLRKNKIQTSP